MAHRGIFSRTLVEQYDFSGVSTGMAIEITGNSIDDTTFQAGAATKVAAPAESTISQNSLWRHDTATPTPDLNVGATMNSFLGTPLATVSGLILTDIDACPSYTQLNCATNTMSIEAATADLIRINGGWQGELARRGLRVFGKHATWSPTGTISAIGPQTGIDAGAAGVNGGIAILHLHSIVGGTTGIDIDLESDTTIGFGTPALEATFTMTAPGVQIVNLTGAIGQFLRLNTTDLAGATSFTCTLLAVVRGVTKVY